MDEKTVLPAWRDVFGGKTWRTLGLLLLCALATYVVPGLSRFRPVRAGASADLRPQVRLLIWKEEMEPIAPPPLRPLARADVADALTALRRVTESEPALAGPNPFPYMQASQSVLSGLSGTGTIEDPSGAMGHFYTSLLNTRALQPGAVTRIVHLGDSPIVGDLISGGARERLQSLYGDAGHGWTMPGRPWDWYYHYGVILDSAGWRPRSPLFGNGGTGRCGLNGVAFVSSSPSAVCRVATVSRGLGRAVSHFKVYFCTTEHGGTLLASVDGGTPFEIITSASPRAAVVRDIPVPDGRHVLTLHPKGDGEVSLYGVALERDLPGVVYDSVGASGGTAHFLTLLNRDDWEENLRERAPDLVILNYGTNESTYGYFPKDMFAADYREVVRRVRRTVPEASILLMAPMDRGTRDPAGQIVTLPAIPKLVDAQRAVAEEMGCAFFDTYKAMGGEGTMARWHARENRLVTGDLTHPTPVGADYISKLLVDALEQGCAEYGERRNGK